MLEAIRQNWQKIKQGYETSQRLWKTLKLMKNRISKTMKNLKGNGKSQKLWKTTVYTNTLKLMKNIKVDEKKKVKPRSVKRASLTLKNITWHKKELKCQI